MSDDYTPIFKRNRDGLWFPDELSIKVERERSHILGEPDVAYIRAASLDIKIDEPSTKAITGISHHEYLGYGARTMIESGSQYVLAVKIEAIMNEQEARELEQLLYRVIERVKKEAGVVE